MVTVRRDDNLVQANSLGRLVGVAVITPLPTTGVFPGDPLLSVELGRFMLLGQNGQAKKAKKSQEDYIAGRAFSNPRMILKPGLVSNTR